MAKQKSRRSSRGRQRPIVAGVAWYDAAQWSKLKQVAEDADELDDSHAAWLKNVERMERELTRRGLAIRRVPVDVDALVIWCRGQGKPLAASSRAEYVSELLRTMAAQEGTDA